MKLKATTTSIGGNTTSTKTKINWSQIPEAIAAQKAGLRAINKKIFDNPELGYEEFQAHDNIVAFLESLGFTVTRHAYGLETSFMAEFGTAGRVIAFNAEYDALPGMGHACGHNLISTASLSAFVGLAAILAKEKVPGRVRIIGTPAEEGGGGKLPIIDAKAYVDVDACMMAHPTPPEVQQGKSYTGAAYGTTNANVKSTVTFTGKPAHAAVAPYEGINALDAVTLSYTAISMLRQQTRPEDRIHLVIKEGGERPNIITASSRSDQYVRSPSLAAARALNERVKCCFYGAGMATGCSVKYTLLNEYADLRSNKTMCSVYASTMDDLGSPVHCDFQYPQAVAGSTDQGNVSYECPSFQSTFGIDVPPGVTNHTPGFTACAGTDKSHDAAIVVGKGMAITGWRVLTDDDLARQIRRDFEDDRKIIAQTEPRYRV